jgi:putative addiction module killer protein
MDVREYLQLDGTSPFGEWFAGLDAQAAAKIAMVLARLGQGNLSRVKGVGNGVYESALDWGPGYRIYLGKDGEEIIILLGGGTKKRQQDDIDEAKAYWEDYRRRKKGKA